jgi:hypothetical protein
MILLEVHGHNAALNLELNARLLWKLERAVVVCAGCKEGEGRGTLEEEGAGEVGRSYLFAKGATHLGVEGSGRCSDKAAVEAGAKLGGECPYFAVGLLDFRHAPLKGSAGLELMG